MAKAPNTTVITNFGGRLTRIINGDLNSGFAKFDTSWGYDPFSKPMNLTWFSQPEQPSSIAGFIPDAVLDMETRVEGTLNYVYAIGQAGNFYKIQTTGTGIPTVDSIVGIGSVRSGGPSYSKGASMEFFGTSSVFYISNDNGVNKIKSDFSAEAVVGTSANFASEAYHPLKTLGGKLLVGNSNTFAVIDNTGTVTSSIIGTGLGNLYSQISPPLPTDVLIKDIDTSLQGDYSLMTANGVPHEQVYPGSDRLEASSTNSYVLKWNGIDAAITASQQLPGNVATALQTYLGNSIFFSLNGFGGSLNDGVTNMLTLPNNKSPLPNATTINGNYVTWVAPEVIGNSSMVGTLYYFGSLDAETPKGLYRFARVAPTMANGFVTNAPANLIVNTFIRSADITFTGSIATQGYGKHYFSLMEGSQTSVKSTFWRFILQPNSITPPQAGVYETQTQLFSKRQGISQIRVYTESTSTGNGFQLDLIDTDGSVVENGSFTYTYAAGTDSTKLQGPLQRINFNPNCNTLFGFGVRITNTGTTNMTIKKVEIDHSEEGK